jgi:hypothetical protein
MPERDFPVLFHPVGMTENSPTLQCWVSVLIAQVPKGRLKSDYRSVVPSGLVSLQHPKPNAEALGYGQASLRDGKRPSPAFADHMWPC